MSETTTHLLHQLKDAPYLSKQWWDLVYLLETINGKESGLAPS